VSPALILDCDGVLAETELNGHLPAFNRTFADLGLPLRWSPEEYGQRLSVPGGKERMLHALTPEAIADAGLPSDPERLARAAAGWHAHKTEIFAACSTAARSSPAAACGGWW
jgi:beta-phosphoglucomutase-like phosphatase (HAD superfamily)